MTAAATGDENEVYNVVQVFLEQAQADGQLDASPSPQCRVCRDELIRVLVNKMLARAFTLEDVLDVLEPHNRTLKSNRRVTYDSLRRHRMNHFPMQVPAANVLRNVAEKRAIEAGANIETATGTLVNALSFLETVMIRGYERASDPRVNVSVDEGMKAAVKLHELQRKDEGLMERAQMLAEMNRVISIVRTYVPQERWPSLQAALKGDPTVMEGQISPVAVTPRMVHIDDASEEDDSGK